MSKNPFASKPFGSKPFESFTPTIKPNPSPQNSSSIFGKTFTSGDSEKHFSLSSLFGTQSKTEKTSEEIFGVKQEENKLQENPITIKVQKQEEQSMSKNNNQQNKTMLFIKSGSGLSTNQKQPQSIKTQPVSFGYQNNSFTFNQQSQKSFAAPINNSGQNQRFQINNLKKQIDGHSNDIKALNLSAQSLKRQLGYQKEKNQQEYSLMKKRIEQCEKVIENQQDQIMKYKKIADKLQTKMEGYEGQIQMLVNMVNILNDKVMAQRQIETQRERQRTYQRELFQRQKYFSAQSHQQIPVSPRNFQFNLPNSSRNQQYGIPGFQRQPEHQLNNSRSARTQRFYSQAAEDPSQSYYNPYQQNKKFNSSLKDNNPLAKSAVFAFNNPNLDTTDNYSEFERQSSVKNYSNKKGHFNFQKNPFQNRQSGSQMNKSQKSQVSITKVVEGYIVNFIQDGRSTNIVKCLNIENDFGEVEFLQPVNFHQQMLKGGNIHKVISINEGKCQILQQSWLGVGARIILKNKSGGRYDKMSLQQKIKMKEGVTKLAESEGYELQKIDKTNGDIYLLRRPQ